MRFAISLLALALLSTSLVQAGPPPKKVKGLTKLQKAGIIPYKTATSSAYYYSGGSSNYGTYYGSSGSYGAVVTSVGYSSVNSWAGSSLTINDATFAWGTVGSTGYSNPLYGTIFTTATSAASNLMLLGQSVSGSGIPSGVTISNISAGILTLGIVSGGATAGN
jgi:hypothetical protein